MRAELVSVRCWHSVTRINLFMSKLRDLKEQRASLIANMTECNEKLNVNPNDAELRASWNDLTAKVEKINNDIEAEERSMELQAYSAQKNLEKQNQEVRATDSKLETRAFVKYLLGEELSAEEKAVQRRSMVGTNGGVLVPKSIADRIEKTLGGESGMFASIDVKTTSNGGELTIPTCDVAGRRAVPVKEYTQSTKNGITFDSVALSAHTLRTDIIPISYELLQDSAFDIEQEIANILSDYILAGINYELTNGTGDQTALGIVKSATVVNKAGEGITYDDLINQRKKVKRGYAKNASYMINSATEADLMLLKDANDRPLWTPSLRDDAPAKLLGKPVVINDDMADGEVIYGDLKAYKARMVKGITIVVAKEALVEFLSIGVIGYCRIDGKLVNSSANPVTILK